MTTTTNSKLSAVQHVFVYGSLRPDDDSKMPWTVAAVEGMRGQKGYLPGAMLYKDQYACVVLPTANATNAASVAAATSANNSSDDETTTPKVIGWVLTASDPKEFGQKLEYFDQIEGYQPGGGGLYDRAVANVVLSDPSQCIGTESTATPAAIGEKGQVIQAYVYHRPDCQKHERIPSGDWLQRNRDTTTTD